MALTFFNTFSRTLEEFKPITQGKVGLYTCGPTIYNFAHIGNFRAYVFEDLLRRYLEYKGYDVFHVMNLTDVEDKIIKACRETGQPLKAVTGKFATAFFEDVRALRIKPAHLYPAATDYIPEMVEMIKRLRDNGHTYEVRGSIYFKISTFPGYGGLSHMNLNQLQAGASGRVDADEYESDNARDFALWKAWDENDGDVYWETELGKGRPGWHIECSAMSNKHLGPHFDIHCGGVDNIFPHHENELAQSRCATGEAFVNYWLHCAHLVVEGRKMSKSLGNFYTLRDLLARGTDPLVLRWALISTHYRQPNNFSFEVLDAAGRAISRIRDFRLSLSHVTGEGSDLSDHCAKCAAEFEAEMDNDLNISGALRAVFNFIRDVNRELTGSGVSTAGAANAIALLDQLDAVTGIFRPGVDDEAPAEVMEMIVARQQARRERNFAESDRLRDAMLAAGWIVEDTPKGPRVKKA
jgi:cysteinyl-tRNA synthetase